MIRRPTSKATGWVVAAVLGALLAWHVVSDTPLRLGDRSLRVYDARDLLVDVPDFRVDRGGEADEDERTRDDRVDELAEQIRTHVAPGTWGPDDLINFSEGQRLLIVTSEAKHRLVQDFFEQVRATQRVQVTVEARFLTIGDGSSGQLDDALGRIGDDDDAPGPVFLDDAQVRSLLRASQASPKSTIITAPRMTVYNGQRSYTLVATQRAYVSDLRANRAADGSVTYDSTIDSVESGIVFEVRATASADRRRVTLYLHPRLTQLRGIDTLHVGVSPDGKDLAVQRPNLWTAEVHQTVSIPAGKTFLIRSILKPRDAAANGEKRADAPEEVVLLVKATVIDASQPAATAPATAPTTAATPTAGPAAPAE